MNNSKIALENVDLADEPKYDNKPSLRKKEVEITEILEALRQINNSKYWQILTDKLFQVNVDKLSKQLRSEKNPTQIYRLQGKLEEAEKPLNFLKEIQALENELIKVRNLLNE